MITTPDTTLIIIDAPNDNHMNNSTIIINRIHGSTQVG